MLSQTGAAWDQVDTQGLHRAYTGSCQIRLRQDKICKLLILLVPGTGIEPVRGFPRGILSPLRLPISPPGLEGAILFSAKDTGCAVPCGRSRTPVLRGICASCTSAALGLLSFAAFVHPARHLPISPPGLVGAVYLVPRIRSCVGDLEWRLGSESNRRTRSCSPLHDHSATQPVLFQIYLMDR